MSATTEGKGEGVGREGEEGGEKIGDEGGGGGWLGEDRRQMGDRLLLHM